MRYKNAIKEHAQSLYVIEGKSIGYIASMMKIPEKTLYRWKHQYKWDSAVGSGTINLVGEMQKAFYNKVQEAIQNGSLTDPSTADSLYKTSKLMEKLLPKKMMLANIFSMLEDIISYTRTYIEDDRFIEALGKYLPEIADFLRKKYSENL
jgi:hypothetical protein